MTGTSNRRLHPARAAALIGLALALGTQQALAADLFVRITGLQAPLGQVGCALLREQWCWCWGALWRRGRLPLRRGGFPSIFLVQLLQQ
jgi:hypothetical protein